MNNEFDITENKHGAKSVNDGFGVSVNVYSVVNFFKKIFRRDKKRSFDDKYMKGMKDERF